MKTVDQEKNVYISCIFKDLFLFSTALQKLQKMLTVHVSISTCLHMKIK